MRRETGEPALGYAVDDWEDLAPLGDWEVLVNPDPVGLETRMRSSDVGALKLSGMKNYRRQDSAEYLHLVWKFVDMIPESKLSS